MQLAAPSSRCLVAPQSASRRCCRGIAAPASLRQAACASAGRCSVSTAAGASAVQHVEPLVANNVVNGPDLAVMDVGKSTNIRWHEAMVERSNKELLLGQRGCVLWFTGLSGSGKSTVACTLEHLLHERGHFTSLLDGDNVRHGLNKDLGFTAADRTENIRRIGEVARLFADAGTITMTSFISPYQADRDMVRERCKPGEFLEVYMDIPIEVCEERDPKGLYKKARAGLIKNFTGIDDPYEAPLNPEIVVRPYDNDGRQRTPAEMAEQILGMLDGMGYLRDPAMPTLKAATAVMHKHSDGVLDYAAL